MVLISAETILPMFLLWSRLCEHLQSFELPLSESSLFWVKPEWHGDVIVYSEVPALEEVGLPQRVGNLVRGTPSYYPRATGKAPS